MLGRPAILDIVEKEWVLRMAEAKAATWSRS